MINNNRNNQNLSGSQRIKKNHHNSNYSMNRTQTGEIIIPIERIDRYDGKNYSKQKLFITENEYSDPKVAARLASNEYLLNH